MVFLLTVKRVSHVINVVSDYLVLLKNWLPVFHTWTKLDDVMLKLVLLKFKPGLAGLASNNMDEQLSIFTNEKKRNSEENK